MPRSMRMKVHVTWLVKQGKHKYDKSIENPYKLHAYDIRHMKYNTDVSTGAPFLNASK